VSERVGFCGVRSLSVQLSLLASAFQYSFSILKMMRISVSGADFSVVECCAVLTRSLTHALIYSCMHALTHSLTHSLTQPLTHCTHCIMHSLNRSLLFTCRLFAEALLPPDP
jgi:hypothetical protein